MAASDLSLNDLADKKILILDGAMGTMIQQLRLTEFDFRGKELSDHPCNLSGCNDILCITRPDAIKDIHLEYLRAGADIIETNSFNANAISLSDYCLSDRDADINRQAALLARQAVDIYHNENRRPCFVAGSIGPTNKSLTMAVTLGDPIDWDTMTMAYFRQITALIEGGVDLLIIETIFDTLNAKSAIYAAKKAMRQTRRELPLVLSATLTENGRTLSGQTLEAFVRSTAHARPFATGLNCGFGIDGMKPHIDTLHKLAGRVSIYANAGLPDKLGQYTETPAMMAEKIEPLMKDGLINITGGCCGTTPAHIAAIAEVAKRYTPRKQRIPDNELTLAGLEPLTFTPERNFVNVGERCNVAGSRKFLRLIKENSLDEALDIARTQVAGGAQIIDVNMDDGMLDSQSQMTKFLRLTQIDPEIARVPIMIDSSDWDVIVAGLKTIQGKPIVNSISLKEGEDKFLDHARQIKLFGAAMVVMAFDEQGQATTFKRKTEICERSYRLLVEKAGISPTDIIFDPNILAVATGLSEHSRYAIDFLETIKWIKANLPGAKISGGLSNLSFSFRGNNTVREAMHSLFLHHAISLGMDMAIVNAAALPSAEDIEPRLAKAIDDVIFDRSDKAADTLVDIAQEIMSDTLPQHAASVQDGHQSIPDDPVVALAIHVSKGLVSGLDQLVDNARERLGSAVEVINGPLMDAMNRVGRLFGEGKIFLPQVVKSASAMKTAVNRLTPWIEAEKKDDGSSASRPKMVIATVKGDVHDIGKNIVSVIMRCNGFEVIDLGVMVPAEKIVETALSENADLIGLSGLITPSLEEMCNVARLMEKTGLSMPLFIGGATTSDIHTAVKIAPLYSAPVVHGRDAAQMPGLVSCFINPMTAAETRSRLTRRQQEMRQAQTGSAGLLPIEEARKHAPRLDYSCITRPRHIGTTDLTLKISDLRPLINWRAYLAAWNLDASLATAENFVDDPGQITQWLASLPAGKQAKATEAIQLMKDAGKVLDSLETQIRTVNARIVILPAASHQEDILIKYGDKTIILPTLRQQNPDGDNPRLSLADYISPPDNDGSFKDFIGLFAVTTGNRLQELTDRKNKDSSPYEGLLYRSVADRLAEAATEAAHRYTAKELWGFAPDINGEAPGIRPAVGYPSLPDQSLIFVLDRMIHYDSIGIHPTETGALNPAASTTGLIIPHPEARYFIISAISDDQRDKYLKTHPLSGQISDLSRFLPHYK